MLCLGLESHEEARFGETDQVRACEALNPENSHLWIRPMTGAEYIRVRFITHCYELNKLNDLIGGSYKSGLCYILHHHAAIGHMKAFIESQLQSRDFLLPLLTTLKNLSLNNLPYIRELLVVTKSRQALVSLVTPMNCLPSLFPITSFVSNLNWFLGMRSYTAIPLAWPYHLLL